ncbi:YceI family protein [Stappia indica]|uniref:YceI family protein n=1 Tax=Stappia indica TaxID=538381 RepID=UPI001CD6494A|nr:YceI family protein [Stappia indica]MCA1297259.1 YceI family protein [Stappia indica]
MRAPSALTRLLVAGTALVLAALPAAASDWSVDPAASSLSFTAQQGESPVDGSFATWSAEIRLDPADLANAAIRAEIETGSATTGQMQIDQTLPSEAWFNVAAFPKAVFVSDSITATGGDSYTAAGRLTIKDHEQPLTLPFTLTIDGDTAHATAEVSVMRMLFGIGADIPAATVADEVTIRLDITATR